MHYITQLNAKKPLLIQVKLHYKSSHPHFTSHFVLPHTNLSHGWKLNLNAGICWHVFQLWNAETQILIKPCVAYMISPRSRCWSRSVGFKCLLGQGSISLGVDIVSYTLGGDSCCLVRLIISSVCTFLVYFIYSMYEKWTVSGWGDDVSWYKGDRRNVIHQNNIIIHYFLCTYIMNIHIIYIIHTYCINIFIDDMT